MPGNSSSGFFRRSPARPRPRPSSSATSSGAGPRPGGAGPGRLSSHPGGGVAALVTVGAALALVGATLGAGAATAAPAASSAASSPAASTAADSAQAAAAADSSDAAAGTAQSDPANATADGLVTLAGVRPGWAQPQDATGVPSADSTLTTRVFLAGRDPQGLAAYATSVSTPGNTSYRRYLSATAAASRFGPSAAEGTAVASWLRASGLEVTSVTGQYVEAAGTVGAVEKAYGVTLRTYRAAADGATDDAGNSSGGGNGGGGGNGDGDSSAAADGGSAVAPDRDPAVPARIAADVATVTGLSTLAQPMFAQHLTAAAAEAELRDRDGGGGWTAPTGPLIPSPCSSYYGQQTDTTDPADEGVHEPYAVCGYSAAQLRSAYGATGHNGYGATVAVLDAYDSPTMRADANTWSAHSGLPGFSPSQYTEHVTPSAWTDQSDCGGTAGWAAEQALDVEAVHAMAPHAKILYYGANSCQDSDLLAALSDLITHHLAQVISNSWGGPLHSSTGGESASTIAEYEHYFELAAVEGITVNFSSGDCGDNDPSSGCGSAEGSTLAQTTFPAADPWVTAVGGTSGAVDAHGHLDWSTSWGTDAWLLNAGGTIWEPLGWVFGGGGGASADFAEPHYQQHHVPSALAGTLLTGAAASGPRRVVPDLSLDADPFTGMLVGATQPLPDGTTGYAEAAIGGTSLASPLLAGLEADAIAERGGVPIGFVNPTLYCGCMHGDALHDVTASPSNVTSPIAEVFPPFQGQAAALAGLGDDGALEAAPGFDDATGLGTPGPLFIEELAAR